MTDHGRVGKLFISATRLPWGVARHRIDGINEGLFRRSVSTMQTKLYHCRGCGYRANVIGGMDRDQEVRLKTMVCRQCHTVVDAVVARRVTGQTEAGAPTERWDDVPGKCPHCDGNGLVPWPLDRPCPRCGEEMES